MKFLLLKNSLLTISCYIQQVNMSLNLFLLNMCGIIYIALSPHGIQASSQSYISCATL